MDNVAINTHTIFAHCTVSKFKLRRGKSFCLLSIMLQKIFFFLSSFLKGKSTSISKPPAGQIEEELLAKQQHIEENSIEKK